ncbi:hypothetical protein [Abyssisolibacter fermentans]|uniref:hypothetical protein n=1 Tax=Abyssisolibacter fermentans TaxID=1766203 RepID=UPI0012E3C3CE|nr:hypothetical protein [Abyssisolibacter fermentans]
MSKKIMKHKLIVAITKISALLLIFVNTIAKVYRVKALVLIIIINISAYAYVYLIEKRK